MASSSAIGKLSREEFRRQKDLEAARKAGTAPAAVDAEGRAINPHIPQYISQAPWYLDTGGPSLDHQRRQPDDRSSNKLDEWYDRGKRAGPAATKFRKGACDNCGAMTHKTKDCLERPRKKGARYTGKDMQPDEMIQNFETNYDAKRDRWNGYDPAEYKRVYEEYAAIETARRKIREEEIDNQTSTDLAAARKVAKVGKEKKDDDFGSSDEEDADEDKYADAADAVGQKMDAKTRITVRNLRIREDTAKYLMNLDPDSAYYDPKTRSMRDAPHPEIQPEDAPFAGENFLRHSGDAPNIQKLQLFAWQSAARGNDIHLQANPTQGEILHDQYQEKKEELKETNQSSILAKYGGEEYLEKVPKELLGGQTEDYVEYSRTGHVIRGRERAKARSRYDENVYPGNHTSVWGSWYDLSSGKWGFACCHSSISNSYCTGAAGIRAVDESSAEHLLHNVPLNDRPSNTGQLLADREKEPVLELAEVNKQQESSFSKRRLGEGNVLLDQSKLEAAIKEERHKRRKGDDEEEEWKRDKKQKYSSFSGSTEVTEEGLEAYRRSRIASTEDPMANYVDEGDR
ncbi:pre-mRNA-splicing factor SLU7 [Cantharellus anzutake]|uniref:pre-mRNA-splicing factor SLU7 n=1 Tax=Cantharellus anzutake TaxID=1750568 RepID=UPI001905E684|nr:pre-mRNA-splicing factor SLU7 [Cantharellus anzutake]KAF8325158.1 pre-mRNA-splicing factor SLU7 [Cantharellus anzutake]